MSGQALRPATEAPAWAPGAFVEDIAGLLADLDRELVGLAPVKRRIAEIAALLAVDKARAAAKPPKPLGEVAISAPPATITSASPYIMMRAASPMLCAPVAQADTSAIFGPFMPYMIETLPEIMLIILLGTKNGEILRGPPSINAW